MMLFQWVRDHFASYVFFTMCLCTLAHMLSDCNT
jgi:hypothetical protein